MNLLYFNSNKYNHFMICYNDLFVQSLKVGKSTNAGYFGELNVLRTRALWHLGELLAHF